jgi:hypothetical protein
VNISAAGFGIRPAESEDLSFIHSSWLKSLLEASLKAGYFEMWPSPGRAKTIYEDTVKRGRSPDATVAKLYWSEMPAAVSKYIVSGSVCVLYDLEDSGHIAGWICREADLVRYMYLKHDYRDLGLATALLDGTDPRFALAGFAAVSCSVSA